MTSASTTLRVGVVLALTALTGCSLPSAEEIAAGFTDVGFVPGAAVQDLDTDELEPLMTEVSFRLRSYLALREAVPFDALGGDPDCVTDSQVDGATVELSVDASCALGGEVEAAGQIVVTQSEVGAEGPDPVLETTVDYEEVQVGGLVVVGTEHAVEVADPSGPSIRTLELEQNGVTFSYVFRVEILETGEPIFDYEMAVTEGPVQVRLTTSSSPGAFVAAYVIGTDGALTCEIRDTAWENGEAAEGFCENGATFGF